MRRVPQLAAYILKFEQKVRGLIDWGADDVRDAQAAWLQRVRSNIPCMTVQTLHRQSVRRCYRKHALAGTLWCAGDFLSPRHRSSSTLFRIDCTGTLHPRTESCSLT